MTDQLLEALTAIDPARYMPPASSVIREAIREGVLAATIDDRPARPLVGSRDSRTRRPSIVAVTAMLALLIPLGGWVYVSYFSNRQTVVDEFRAAQQEMPLPAGVAGVIPDLPANASYGSGFGFITAWNQSTHAWLTEWVTAHKAGDHARERAAITAMEHQVDLMPLHKEGDTEQVGGFDQQSVDFTKALVEKMKQGEPADIEQYLRTNP